MSSAIPLSPRAPWLFEPGVEDFVRAQNAQFGANLEVETGVWAVFGVGAADRDAREQAEALLATADFAFDSGQTEDDCWTLYYVDDANRAAALHWLEDLHAQLDGLIRRPSLRQRALFEGMIVSEMPHRLAQTLVEQKSRGELSAGSACHGALIRALLDRLHARDPIFYSAFQLLLTHHLLDLVVVLEQLVPEDVELATAAMRGSLARDPLQRLGQTAAAEIRQWFTQFHVINSLDQEKNSAGVNPYAAYFDVVQRDDNVILTLEGREIAAPRTRFVQAIRSVRRNLYRGGEFHRFDTQAPWISEEIAYPFRFIKQRLDMHREISVLDGLFMLERALD
jgi:hypothetical protein